MREMTWRSGEIAALQQARDRLVVGRTYQFTSEEYGLIRGTLTGFGPKNALLLTDGGAKWRVAPGALKEVQ